VAPATDIVTEWERCAGGDFKIHFEQARSYFSSTVSEVASDEATWTVTAHEGRSVLLLAGDTGFALVAFSGPPGGVTMKGALHPLDEGVIRVSFSDEIADEGDLVRRWAFDWHGRLQLPIEYRVPTPWAASAGVPAPSEAVGAQHERQRAVAHKLAAAAGWPMPGNPQGA
jgi:hypothetical protein